jgi:opacity protein-like surface antigen
MRELFFASVVSATSLAGALAAGVLCDALICEPARAVFYAFGSTLTSGNAVLELDVDGTWELLTTLGVQGWISGGAHGTGGPYGTNPSYTAGFYQGNDYNDYFGFNLAALDLPAGTTITAANLVVYSGNHLQQPNLQSVRRNVTALADGGG